VRHSSLRARLAGALLALPLTALLAYPDTPYNPFTGRGKSEDTGYNPFVRGVRRAVNTDNPYTGRGRSSKSSAKSAPNPFTGKGAPRSEYNEYTGRYGTRADKRTLPGGALREVPITGKAAPGLEYLDDVMLRVMEKWGIPGGALAVVKDGKLVLARGYGWGNLASGAPVVPEAIFPTASLSKPITAAAVLKLVDDGKLKLDDKAFRLLGLRPPPGARVDPRIYTITIRQLLNHSAGWDRARSGEPSSFSWRVARQLRVPLPITTEQLIRYMMGQRLDFTPGSQQQYSNFGYIVLGQVIAHVSRQSYGEYVQKNVLRPMGIRGARLPARNRAYHDDEVRLYAPGTYQLVPADYLPTLEDAAGGWRVSVVDMARFMSAFSGTRAKKFLSDVLYKQTLAPPPPPLKTPANTVYVGLCWDGVQKTPRGFSYWKNGLLPGCRTFMGHLPNGVDWVLLFNSGQGRLTLGGVSAEMDPQRGVEKPVQRVKKWPKVDYFKDYR
jgi:N-acyl-D-amino-acid deacylase